MTAYPMLTKHNPSGFYIENLSKMFLQENGKNLIKITIGFSIQHGVQLTVYDCISLSVKHAVISVKQTF